MIPYILMIAFPILATALFGRKSEDFDNDRRQKIIVWIFFGCLFILLALRHEDVGVDMERYLNHFKSISDDTLGEILKDKTQEQGFWILNKFISIFSTSERFYLVVMAACTLIPVAILYSKNSENAMLTIAIFIVMSNFAIMFTAIRQAIAVGIVALSYKYVKEKKFWKFLIFIVIAFFFHQSALIALLLYPFYHMNITKMKLLFFVPVLGFVLAFNKPIFEFLLQFLGEYGENYEAEETGAFMMILLIAVFVFAAYVIPTDENMDEETKGLRGISVLALLLQTFSLVSTVAMRMNYYFILFIPLLMPRIFNRCAEKNIRAYKTLSLLLAVFLIAYFIYKGITGGDILEMYPYKFLWEE